MARYSNADFKDCRINAYPYNDLINYNDKIIDDKIDDKIDDRYNNKIPNLLFIDLDRIGIQDRVGIKKRTQNYT